jgi:ATP-dependent DNA helicase RecQ
MTIHQLLEKYWGYSHFRSLQEEIIRSVIGGNDTLALMPTGGGKSLCFQLPALFSPGICIVVSPLIALMKDQVENLKAKGIQAIAIVSGMGKREVDILLDNCIYGNIKFLYLSPERLLSDLVRERIRNMKVNLIAIDEAHCISQWGYDFRPPYLRLPELRALHPDVPVLALTATATPRVATDICEKLQFRGTAVFRKSFERKNLAYVVFNEENKPKRLFSIAHTIRGCGIVYVRSRKETQETARLLVNEGISADFYHAGLDTAIRSAKQDAWKQNRTRIMVATNAFGMGIDKPDVRFVVHLDPPESPEAYYQEAGRAGRDEKKAYAVLLFQASDALQLRKKLAGSFPSAAEIKKIYHHLANFYQLAYGAGEGLSYDFDLTAFCSRFKMEPLKVINALKFLEKNEYLAFTESVFLPSRVKFIAGPEELYRFQIGHALYDPFIKLLLRSYGGLFDQYVAIREYDLSKRINANQEEITVVLEKLKELGVIDYTAYSDGPRVQFIKPRVSGQHLFIDLNYLKQRKEIATRQVESMISYAETLRCRSIQLQAYFGDIYAPACGICDVCLAEKKKRRGVELRASIENEAIQLLSSGHLELGGLIGAIRSGTEKERISVIRELLDAGKLKSDGDKYYL